MCGIFGVINGGHVTNLLLQGLRSLEYRGYDSAGLAVLREGRIERRRAAGKLSRLESVLGASPLDGRVGIAHTRWATHGLPTQNNAHPHATQDVAVVHNGIVENYTQLRDELMAKGVVFASDTDSEVIPHLITDYLRQGMKPLAATRAAVARLHGSFALGVLFRGASDFLLAVRRGSPLAVGIGEHAGYLASDCFAMASMANEFMHLEEGDQALVFQNKLAVFDAEGSPTTRKVKKLAAQVMSTGKGSHRHYMHKEIFQQPEVLTATLHSHIDVPNGRVALGALPWDFSAIDRITIVACGTSYYAGSVAKYWFEQIARINVDIDIASEFRYRNSPLGERGLAIFISQSGETADTLAALRYAKQQGQHTLALVNVPESSLAREAHATLLTLAGPEVGVASTKAFSTQLALLALLALQAARQCGQLLPQREKRLVSALLSLPETIAMMLENESLIHGAAEQVASARDVLFLGRGAAYPIALEGALKLKEVSYIHAEGYAAGELKHGPIALVDAEVPVVVLAPDDALLEKTLSNAREVMARRGRVILLSGPQGHALLGKEAASAVCVPDTDPLWAPFLYVVPLQLLAYHVALIKGTDVDQPRNLAKSVTVE
jgi:glucosamine--fructose-6-phosphate aminotransferase (isomerizing)